MKKQTLHLSLLVLASAFFPLTQSGCAPAKRLPAAASILTPQHFTVTTLGYSIEKRPIELYLAGTGPDTIFIFSGIHGNEQAGISLVHRLMDRLHQQSELLEGRKILIIPVANPDGVARNTRGNARGIDLNRNFSADNRENSAIAGCHVWVVQHPAKQEQESGQGLVLRRRGYVLLHRQPRKELVDTRFAGPPPV